MNVIGIFSIIRKGIVEEESKEALKGFLEEAKAELEKLGFELMRANVARRDEIMWDDEEDEDEDEDIVDNLDSEVKELESWIKKNPK